RGSLAVHLLRLPFMPLAGFPAERFSLVVNATPCGRNGECPFALDRLRDDAVVVDLVYGNAPTPLVEHMRANGQIAIDGKDMLITLLGWWRYADVRNLTPEIVLSSLGLSLIIGSTTVAYTFNGISIVLALLLMRGGLLIMGPITDAVFGRRVRWFSWAALGVSL